MVIWRLGTKGNPSKRLSVNSIATPSPWFASLVWGIHLSAVGLVVADAFGPLSQAAIAQITSDSSLPTDTIVTLNGAIHEITAGTTRGTNLFHSFSDFSLPTGETAFFNQDGAIANIFSRVTGDSISDIDGLIRANGTANLFLINPNGLVLGENARLDIGGSFMGSTAESIQFDDGVVFSGSDTQTTLLTINTPIGLQYGNNPGSITVNGNGSNLALVPRNQRRLTSDRISGFQVSTGQTLALVGGALNFIGGNITASEGRIELGSVGANSQVSLQSIDSGWILGYDGVDEFQSIQLTQAASVDTSGDGAGAIQVQGGDIRLQGGSSILAIATGSNSGQDVSVTASESLILKGFAIDEDGSATFPSSILTDVARNRSVTGGNIRIAASIIRAMNGGEIAATTSGVGDGGNVSVDADRIILSGGIPELASTSGFSATVLLANATGNSGDMTIATDTLIVRNGAALIADSFGSGNTGDIEIVAQSIAVDFGAQFLGASVIAATNGGDLRIATDTLDVTNGAQIFVSTFDDRDAGQMQIVADTINLFGTSPNLAPGGLFSEVFASGDGGTIKLITRELSLAGGALISSSTFDTGNAGNINLQAEHISLEGTPASIPQISTQIVAAVEDLGEGKGGDIVIETESLTLLDAAQIATATESPGDAGDLTVTAQTITLSGSNSVRRGGLLANAIRDQGDGGSIEITADKLTLENSAVVNVGNFASSDPTGQSVQPGQGDAGSIQVTAGGLTLSDESAISANSVNGLGNIALETDILFLTEDSQISTNNQGNQPGGNITLDASSLLVALQNSDITANAVNNRGGQIDIRTELIFGTEVRDRLTPESDITAIGTQVGGSVTINSPDAEPDRSITRLPNQTTDESRQVARACQREQGDNHFVLTGRGGLPSSPYERLSEAAPWSDFRPLTSMSSNTSLGNASTVHPSTASQTNLPVSLILPQQLIEADGIVRQANGSITLMAIAPSSAPSALGHASCHASSQR